MQPWRQPEHEVDAVLLLCRWRAVRDESIKRNIRAGRLLERAESAARTVDDAGVVPKFRGSLLA